MLCSRSGCKENHTAIRIISRGWELSGQNGEIRWQLNFICSYCAPGEMDGESEGFRLRAVTRIWSQIWPAFVNRFISDALSPEIAEKSCLFF